MGQIEPGAIDEWAAANAKYGARARKARVRTALSLAAFGGVFFAVVLGAGSVLAEREQKETDQLAEQGLRPVYYKRGRQISEGERSASSGFVLFVVAAGVASAAAAGVFFAMGGRLSAEHTRGLDLMRR
jgi:hypothetical protein